MTGRPKLEELPGRITDPVRSVTAFEVLWAEPDDSVMSMAQRMRAFGCGALLVKGLSVESEEPDVPAIISERDLLRSIVDGDDHLAARDLATTDPVSIHADAHVSDAAAAMAIAGIRHLVVLDGERHGIVSVRDLLEPLLASAIE